MIADSLSLPPSASSRRYALRLVVTMVASIAIGFGIAVMISAHIGVAPNDVLTTGIAHHTPLTPGTATLAVAAVTLLAAAVLGRRPNIGTVINFVLVGPTITAGLHLVPTFSGPSRVGYYVVGLLLAATGIAAFLAADIGLAPMETLMMVFVDRGHRLVLVRTLLEVLFLVVGTALGGQLGVGTLVFALTIGILLAHGKPIIEGMLRFSPPR
jgi:uncharacterized membrane protein YczE